MGPIDHTRPLGACTMVGTLVVDRAGLDCNSDWGGSGDRCDPEGLGKRRLDAFQPKTGWPSVYNLRDQRHPPVICEQPTITPFEHRRDQRAPVARPAIQIHPVSEMLWVIQCGVPMHD